MVDTQALALEKVIPGLGFVATGVTLDDKSGKLYISNLQGQLYTIDARTLEVEGKAEIAADQALNLVFDGRNKRILATDQGMERITGMRQKLGKLDYQNRGEGNRVVVIDPRDGKLLSSIPTGKGPVALLLDEARDRLYVTNRESGTVSVLDGSDYRLLRTVELSGHPNSLALDGKAGAVYVSVKNGEEEPRGSDE